MEGNTRSAKTKKKNSDESNDVPAKRIKQCENDAAAASEYTAGKVKKVRIRNFMCHEALEIPLNKNVNFIVGRNGSGKSAILAALTVGLGARANVTSRGTSVKEFIKKGKTSAIIEIMLVNKGDQAYKPAVYGDVITVIRTIGINVSSYKIKNWRGETIATKRDELDNIIATMNIQVDNPISILNQDISRTFLVSSKPEEKYILFLKATLLADIEKNYKEALFICEEQTSKLKQHSEALSQVKKEIQKLKENIFQWEEMDSSRIELNNLELEYCWAIAIEEETKLNKIQESLNAYTLNLKEVENMELSVETNNEKINDEIKEIKEKIRQVEEEAVESNLAFNDAKKKHSIANEAYSNKQRECCSVTSKIKRYEIDINLLKKEIQKLESCNDKEHNERKEMKERLSKLEEKLDELEASLRTKQTEVMHLEADKMRLSQEIKSAKYEVDGSDISINSTKKRLNAFEQQSDNTLSVFGPNMPRLRKRIEEEYKKGRFKEKPHGPIGAYIKMKNAAWIPAVESYLGFGTLTTFCVDNNNDAKLLTNIMKEIFYKEKPPQIISSKFYNQVHDVKHHCTQSPRYSNLLEAMVIDDPVVANCLIDQREVECVLLVPTSEEACEIMSDARKVPRNCKRAFTQQGDTFFPDPNYRTYGGRCKRAKFLQVSTMEAMQALKEELEVAENKKRETTAAYNALCEKANRTNSELSNVSEMVRKLKTAQNQCKTTIDNLKDKLESREATSVDIFRNEISELEKKLALERTTEKQLAENVQILQKDVECLKAEVNRCRDLKHNVHTVIDPLKDKIIELTQEKDKHRFELQRATRNLKEIHQTVQYATGEYEKQERATTKAVSNATEKCPRIDTTRSANQIKTLLNELQNKIREVEHQFGSSVDNLRQQLQEKEEKYGENIEFVSRLKESCEKHIKRVKQRQDMFIELRDFYGIYIQKTFTDMLALRQYKGTITIDHVSKRLTLNVSAHKDKNCGNNARSLSGGERSYSTVAFILALWECVQLPFYFLDEFDVFMDKVNRHVVMDILLDHTRSHPESQFVFLTPLDTSHILAEDYVTIHQLQPPERRGLSQ